jgi:hypothetical protein
MEDTYKLYGYICFSNKDTSSTSMRRHTFVQSCCCQTSRSCPVVSISVILSFVISSFGLWQKCNVCFHVFYRELLQSWWEPRWFQRSSEFQPAGPGLGKAASRERGQQGVLKHLLLSSINISTVACINK